MTATMSDRRLIEDYLSLDALNAVSAKEKKHPRHPVALVRYWPARRPTTVSRAAVYAALVPAPDSDDERAEAASFVADLAAFKPDPGIVGEARERIRKAHGGGRRKCWTCSPAAAPFRWKPRASAARATPSTTTRWRI